MRLLKDIAALIERMGEEQLQQKRLPRCNCERAHSEIISVNYDHFFTAANYHGNYATSTPHSHQLTKISFQSRFSSICGVALRRNSAEIL
jgi:hypothetical protein